MDSSMTKTIIALSLTVGLFTYIIADLFVETIWAVLFALLFAACLMALLPLVLYLESRKYKGDEKLLDSPCMLKVNVNYSSEKGIRNGSLYFTRDYLHFISREKKIPIHIQIPKEEVEKMDLVSAGFLHLLTASGSFYQFSGSSCRVAYSFMQMNGWTSRADS